MSLSILQALTTGDAPGQERQQRFASTAGEWHFGAVSHTNAAGMMGLTLVEVDSR